MTITNPSDAAPPILSSRVEVDARVPRLVIDAHSGAVAPRGPIMRLVVAINQYMTTGDRLGEGVYTLDRGILTVMLPHRPARPQDRAEWLALWARWQEQEPAQGGGSPLMLMSPVYGYARGGQKAPKGKVLVTQAAEGGPPRANMLGDLEMWCLVVEERNADAAADFLFAAPGPLGWGEGRRLLTSCGALLRDGKAIVD